VSGMRQDVEGVCKYVCASVVCKYALEACADLSRRYKEGIGDVCKRYKKHMRDDVGYICWCVKEMYAGVCWKHVRVCSGGIGRCV
jgi:hypothetical protein